MAFKDFFIINNEGEKKTTNQNISSDLPKTEQTKFPKTEEKSSFPTSTFQSQPTFNPQSSGPVPDEFIAKATEIYQNGFDSLNQPSYDFYEFYQAINSINGDGPQVYQMAFTMAKTLDKNVNKDLLIQQSQFYIDQINKQYNEFVGKGNSKKNELINQKTNENQALVNELDLLKQQLETIKIQIQDRESKLQLIGSKYEPKITELDNRLAANDVAKNNLIKKIEQVVEGIKLNIK